MISTTVHQEQNWKSCVLKDFTDRNGYNHAVGKRGVVNNTFLEKELDLSGGHFRIGSADHLVKSNTSGLTKRVQHVVFFREAAVKFVSGKVYIKSRKHDITMDFMIDVICQHVHDSFRIKGEYHSKHSQYLLTPSQRQECNLEQCLNNREKMQQVTNVTIQNVLDYNVVVGMVERMPESLKLLDHVLGVNDGRRRKSQQSQPASQARRRATASDASRIPPRYNPSAIPASEVLRVLQQHNSECYSDLVEHVKYEQMVTDSAMKMHTKQYNAIHT